MAKTGIVRDDRYMNHDMGAGHPESPKRLEVIYAMLEEPEMKDQFHDVPVRRAEKQELEWIHSSEYVEMVASTEGKDHTPLDPDTSTSAGSYEAALLASGGLCEAISMVIDGKLDNAFALVRPPGHHAEQARAMGFCLFNNIAIGARFAQESHNLDRILIIDWDLHHGNGTQHSFEDNPSILYFSTHQYPYYPGTGAFNEVGIGKGEGYTVNVPLSMGYGNGEYVGIFEKILKPITQQFNPELILVSAGFDIYDGDPLGGMNVTSDGFAALTKSIMDMARESCNGRVVITLEGGYNLTGLRDGVQLVIKELSGSSKIQLESFLSEANGDMLNYTLRQVAQSHGRYWKDIKM